MGKGAIGVMEFCGRTLLSIINLIFLVSTTLDFYIVVSIIDVPFFISYIFLHNFIVIVLIEW